VNAGGAEPEPVKREAAILGAGKAMELIDNNTHKPRANDRELGQRCPCPFHSVDGVTIEDAWGGRARLETKSGNAYRNPDLPFMKRQRRGLTA